MKLLTLALLIFLPLQLANAQTCAEIFRSSEHGAFAWQGFHTFTLGSERVIRRTGYFRSKEPATESLRMSFDYTRAVNRVQRRPVALLIHGVLDRREDLENLSTELLNRGWDLLRVDLLGHGRSLELNRGTLDVHEPIEFQTQVAMLKALTLQVNERFGLSDLVIVGHSLGGGLAMPLAKELRVAGLEPIAVVPIAPLLLSIDKFLRRQGLSPNVLVFYNEQLISKLHIQNVPDVYNNTLYIQMWQMFFRVLVEPALLLSKTPQMEALVNIMDSINDPMLKKFMETNFKKYQTIKNDHRPKEAKLSETQIDEFVQGGIAATMGSRDVDFQASRGATELDPHIPTLLLSGDHDAIVIPPQIEDFKIYATNKNFDVTFVEMPGDHFLPQKEAGKVSDAITQFLVRRRLLNVVKP